MEIFIKKYGLTYCLVCVDGTVFECNSIEEIISMIKNVLRYFYDRDLAYFLFKIEK